ncbi:MAG: PRC-barrel domain-containing protein [Candidatus Thermoplasmatota archaeon]|jgi:sporulation protein YlmC with PRC-barrel domain|nr:PRC-barrel domain-containing protein [Candidatus Thermoplasmatota archaeon]MDP7264019.1 PRC-barrel domain-containing protein [Candidatus Thermoplasmatota archaeon]
MIEEKNKFVTDLRGKTIMSATGDILGIIDNFVVDTGNGAVKHVLVAPTEHLDLNKYKVDNMERLVLPFNKINAVKDVVVMAPL